MKSRAVIRPTRLREREPHHMDLGKPYSSQPKKSTLQILKGGKPQQQSQPLRQIGVSPSPQMPAGDYQAVCESARIAPKFGKTVVEFSFRIAEGDHFGTVVPGWIHLPVVNVGVYPGKYTAACAVVLGREIEPGDDIEPDGLFVGKYLHVRVRFSTGLAKGAIPKDPDTRKGSTDYLRVGESLESSNHDDAESIRLHAHRAWWCG